MKFEGGCYCGQVRYVADGEPLMRAQCHCRECQYISGGGPNFFLVMPAEGFRYTKGKPSGFTRSDLERPVTREFCPSCGTHLVAKPYGMPMNVIKVGTLDNPTLFGAPQIAMYTIDKQPFHLIAAGVPAVERSPRPPG